MRISGVLLVGFSLYNMLLGSFVTGRLACNLLCLNVCNFLCVCGIVAAHFIFFGF